MTWWTWNFNCHSTPPKPFQLLLHVHIWNYQPPFFHLLLPLHHATTPYSVTIWGWWIFSLCDDFCSYISKFNQSFNRDLYFPPPPLKNIHVPSICSHKLDTSPGTIYTIHYLPALHLINLAALSNVKILEGWLKTLTVAYFPINFWSNANHFQISILILILKHKERFFGFTIDLFEVNNFQNIVLYDNKAYVINQSSACVVVCLLTVHH